MVGCARQQKKPLGMNKCAQEGERLRIPVHCKMGLFSLDDFDTGHDVGNDINDGMDKNIDGHIDLQDDVEESSNDIMGQNDTDEAPDGNQHLSNNVDLQDGSDYSVDLGLDVKSKIVDNDVDIKFDIGAKGEVSFDDVLDLGLDLGKSPNVDLNDVVNNAANDSFFVKIEIC